MTDTDYIIPIDKIRNFKLSEKFIEKYKGKQPEWGYNGLGQVVYKRTYARQVDGGPDTEEFWQTIKRVVEGTYTVQKAHCYKNRLPWDNQRAQKSAQEMYDLMWNFKFLPPGRGLWMMGTDFVYKNGNAALCNCGFVSTRDIDSTNYSDPFVWLMAMSFLGVGVGFDTDGAGKVRIVEPRTSNDVHVVEDSREGWCTAAARLLNAYTGKGSLPGSWDTSGVRDKGKKINGFGGTASGPGPLIDLLENLDNLYRKNIGNLVTSEIIVDTFNLAGKCIVAGGVRRTAQIGFGYPEDSKFLDLKNPEVNPDELSSHRWASNNSIYAEVGMDYSDVAHRTSINGEPGYIWLDNMRKFGRMMDPPCFSDIRVKGANPCVEQSLESFELCNLVETFPANHFSIEEYKKTLKYAYLYAKTVTLIPSHDPRTNSVMMRNRRIGLSQTGIIQSFNRHGRREHLRWCDEGYKYIQDRDRVYSEWLCVPRSVKTTSVKPSGTVSLLAGATPGIHFPHSKFYIRRVRVGESSPMWMACENAGYHVEDCIYAPSTKVISFPVEETCFDRTKYDVTIWEQVSIASLMQRYWADNQVSATVTFNKDEAKDVKNVLEIFEDTLKGISFLPIEDHKWDQAPYETIDHLKYMDMVSKISNIDMTSTVNEVVDKFCDGAACDVQIRSSDDQ